MYKHNHFDKPIETPKEMSNILDEFIKTLERISEEDMQRYINYSIEKERILQKQLEQINKEIAEIGPNALDDSLSDDENK